MAFESHNRGNACVFSVQDETGERRISLARHSLSFFSFFHPSLPIYLSLMHWVFRDPKGSEIVVFRKARIGVVEDGDECGAEQSSSYTRNGWTSSLPSFLCPHFVMVRSIDAVGMQACGVAYPSGDAEDFLSRAQTMPLLFLHSRQLEGINQSNKLKVARLLTLRYP